MIGVIFSLIALPSPSAEATNCPDIKSCGACTADKTCRWAKAPWWVAGDYTFHCFAAADVASGMMVTDNCACDAAEWCGACLSSPGCGWCSLAISPLPGAFVDQCMDSSDINTNVCGAHGENFTRSDGVCPSRDVCQTITSNSPITSRMDCNTFDACGWCSFDKSCRSVTFIKSDPRGAQCDKHLEGTVADAASVSAPREAVAKAVLGGEPSKPSTPATTGNCGAHCQDSYDCVRPVVGPCNTCDMGTCRPPPAPSLKTNLSTPHNQGIKSSLRSEPAEEAAKPAATNVAKEHK